MTHEGPVNAKIHQGDALKILPTIPSNSVELVLTDPPYSSGAGTATARTTTSARGKYVSSDAKHTLADFPGDNRDQRAFTHWLAIILSECLRTATTGASCLVFTDWRQLPATSDALQAAGWTWRGVIPWRKPISRPQRDGFRRECEYVLWGSNGPVYRHAKTVYLPGYVEGSQPRGAGRRHITQKPVEILRQLVRVCPDGGIVLDPFTGSGSTGVAALLEGRGFVGIELTEHYAQIARDRITEVAVPPPPELGRGVRSSPQPS